jgi:16S rRNA (cytosine967-C5)-methyltransferase
VVLHRVAERGAYASRALDAELSRAALPERDAALATEIVYGALRVLPELDRRIAPHLRRAPTALDGFLRAALRAGCYQLAHLTRSPVHAVVDESVSAVRQERGAALAGVANAVLRKLASELEPLRGGPPTDLAVPRWLEQALGQALGETRRARLLEGGSSPPPLGLRVRCDRSREALAESVRGARPNADVRLGAVSPLCLLVRRAGDLRTLPEHEGGHFGAQEEGAQVVALSLGAQPGERLADLCAGHGGKTALLAEAVGDAGEVVAVDLTERKLERIGPELQRLGLGERKVECRAVDLSVGTGGLSQRFDRVLVDAPCSGLGTLRRRPELMLRVTARDPARLAELQLAILRQAVKLVRPGGILLYAVCSPMPVEGPAVALRLEAEAPLLVRCWEPPPGLSGVRPDGDGVVRLGPWLSAAEADSPDVYQMVRWRLDRK